VAYNGKGTRASRLLCKLAIDDWFTSAELARELRVTEPALVAYANGECPIPLDQQLLLATLVIAKVPPLARMGYSLRGQVIASLAYQRQETETHKTAPVARFK
jgi:hypothetical protein